MINFNIIEGSVKYGLKKIFYSSSACMYSGYNQRDPDNSTNQDYVYSVQPDSEY